MEQEVSTTHSFVVLPGASRTQGTRGLGGEISLKVSGKDTGGVWAFFEIPTRPNAGPPLHFHHKQDEWFYVLKGDHHFRIGSDDYIVQAGSSIFGPRMVPHALQNVSEEQGKLLVVVQPAGQLEDFFREFSELSSKVPANKAVVHELFAKYEMHVVGSPLSDPGRPG
jgi:mannose-6-phosphate isomerase-like protein (cupin superfamily)